MFELFWNDFDFWQYDCPTVRKYKRFFSPHWNRNYTVQYRLNAYLSDSVTNSLSQIEIFLKTEYLLPQYMIFYLPHKFQSDKIFIHLSEAIFMYFISKHILKNFCNFIHGMIWHDFVRDTQPISEIPILHTKVHVHLYLPLENIL